MELCKRDKVFVACMFILIALCATALPFVIFHAIETDIAEHSVHTSAEVIATGNRGIQVSYIGDFGEKKTAEIRTQGAYVVGDSIPISVYCGRVDLLEG